MLKTTERIIPLTDLQNDLAGVLRNAQKQPLVITTDGQPVVYMLSVTMFEELLADLADLATIAERHDEPTISHAELLAELKQIFGTLMKRMPELAASEIACNIAIGKLPGESSTLQESRRILEEAKAIYRHKKKHGYSREQAFQDLEDVQAEIATQLQK